MVKRLKYCSLYDSIAIYGCANAGVSWGLRCFVCLPDAATGENCRQIAGQSLQNCTSDTRHCVAVVLGDALGHITVFRGCGGHVQNFKMGSDECTMLDSRQDDLPAGQCYQ